MIRRLLAVAVVVFALIVLPIPKVFAAEAGTLGISVVQLYSDDQPNKRGVLVVRWVEEGSSAAEAGMKAGDIIIAVNGTPIAGHDANEVGKAGFYRSAGESVRLRVIQRGHEPKEMELTFKPYPPHLNPASDAFHYSIPGNWQMDPRYPFPLPWSPTIAYKGFEDLAFAPGFDDVSSPEYHSYLILWWLEGSKPLTADELKSDMITYFRGLAEQRGRNNKFVPDLAKVSAEFSESSEVPQSFGGAAAKGFSGSVTIYDRHGQVITLHSEVITSECAAAGHRAVFFSMSKEPRPAALWKQLDAVRDGFGCGR